MKVIIPTILACSLAMGVSHAVAEEDSEQTVRRIFIDQVKPDKHADYLALSSEWNECLATNNAGHGWSAWEAQTGQMYRYAFVVDGPGWARFDQEDPAHKACYERFAARYTATIESAHGSFDSLVGSISDDIEGEYPVAMVVNFSVSDPRSFFENVAQLQAAARSGGYAHPHSWWYARGGNSGSNVYLVVSLENFAALDSGPNFWAAAISEIGEEAVNRLREQNRQVVDQDWEDIWTWSEELSFTPAE